MTKLDYEPKRRIAAYSVKARLSRAALALACYIVGATLAFALFPVVMPTGVRLGLMLSGAMLVGLAGYYYRLPRP